MVVCILTMQRPGVVLYALYPFDANYELIKVPFIEENRMGTE